MVPYWRLDQRQPLDVQTAEAAAGRDHQTEREPEELGFRHEAQIAAGEEREPKRPRVEVRVVIRGKYERALGEVLSAPRP